MKSETASPILRWDSPTGVRRAIDELATEEPLEIQVDTQPISVTMRTPGHDEELAAGFLLSEGMIGERGDLLPNMPFWRHAQGNVIGVFLADGSRLDLNQLTRHVFASSSCGLCGKATIESVQKQFPPLENDDISVAAELLQELPLRLREAQTTFDRTGGLHAAGLFTTAGDLVVLREDVGRHNAVDKVIGHALLNDLLPLNGHILIVSGRASFEILQKTLAARIPVVAAVSAPSSLAVEFAEANGQTLVGFLRPGRMNVYAGAQRIRFGGH